MAPPPDRGSSFDRDLDPTGQPILLVINRLALGVGVAEIDVAIGQDRDRPLADEHQHLKVFFRLGSGPALEERAELLLPPRRRERGIDISGDAPAAMLGGEHDLRFLRLELVGERRVAQPNTVEGPALAGARLVSLAAATYFAELAPRVHGLVQRADRQHLAAQGAASTMSHRISHRATRAPARNFLAGKTGTDRMSFVPADSCARGEATRMPTRGTKPNKSVARRASSDSAAGAGGGGRSIDLYYWPTPNGWNMLEECRLRYA